MLSILEVNKITEGYSRPVVEGEAYYESGLLFGVGLIEKKGTELRCQGLAVQTSATSGKPHEIDVTIDLKLEIGNRVTSLKCSCIAGLSSKCKHAVATVLWLTRHAEEELSDVSCTDLEQQWGKLKTSGKPLLEGCPLSELCHFKQVKRPELQVPEETRKKWADILTKSAPLSEYSMFFSGLRQCYGEPSCETDAASRRAELELRIRHLLGRKLSPAIADKISVLTSEELAKCDSNVRKFYEEKVVVNIDQSVRICLDTLEQSQSPTWQFNRDIRVSGSRCYALHTYFVNKKPDWESKYQSIYSSNFGGNENTVYGLESESPSRDIYREEKKVDVLLVGSLIRPEIPWLCYSPDGIVLDENGNPTDLYENKSPKEGKRLTATELIENNAVKNFDASGKLKQKNSWNGQVQLGMFLTGLSSTEFSVYSSFEDEKQDPKVKPSIYIDHVIFDEKFTLEMCERICKVYFRELLPRMVAKFSEEE